MNAPPAMRAGSVIPYILTSRYHEDPDPATMQRPSCQPRVCIAKETAESDSAFENRDALDVMGHGEDVERPQGSHAITGRGERRDVTTERRRVAGDVRDTSRATSYDLLGDHLANARPRGVAHHQVHPVRPPPCHLLDASSLEPRLWHVAARFPHGPARQLD